jgi:hypothetical protein
MEANGRPLWTAKLLNQNNARFRGSRNSSSRQGHEGTQSQQNRDLLDVLCYTTRPDDICQHVALTNSTLHKCLNAATISCEINNQPKETKL